MESEFVNRELTCCLNHIRRELFTLYFVNAPIDLLVHFGTITHRFASGASSQTVGFTAHFTTRIISGHFRFSMLSSIGVGAKQFNIVYRCVMTSKRPSRLCLRCIECHRILSIQKIGHSFIAKQAQICVDVCECTIMIS